MKRQNIFIVKLFIFSYYNLRENLPALQLLFSIISVLFINVEYFLFIIINKSSIASIFQ